MNEVSSEAKETILKRYAAGEKVADLARQFNVSRSTIYLWLKKSQDNILKDHSFTAKEFKSLQQKCERLEKIVRILQESPNMRNYPPKDKLSYLEQLYKNGNSVHLICDAIVCKKKIDMDALNVTLNDYNHLYFIAVPFYLHNCYFYSAQENYTV